MKKITFILLALVSGISFAQKDDSATATTFAEIVQPISIESDRNLSFGTIIADPDAAGTVTISPEEEAERTLSQVSAVDEVFTNARFNVTASDYNYSVSMTGTELSGEDGAENTPMVFTPTNNLSADGNDVSATGTRIIYVGGTLDVGAGQGAGEYTGTVTVTVTYE